MDVKTARTIEDVARRVGVSKTTVSSVLNGSRSNTRVSDATRKRIEEAALELNYHPSSVARSLRKGRTNIIGFYGGFGFMSVKTVFLTDIVSGLQEGCDQFGKDLLLHSSTVSRSPNDVYGQIASGKVDGLVLFAAPQDPLIARFASSHLPVILVADAAPELPSVVADDAAAGRLMAQHLWERGHRRVLFRLIERNHTAAKRRFAAFNDEADRLGMTVLMHQGPNNDALLNTAEIACLPGHTQTPVTAVACWCDDWAAQTLIECQRLGLRVPEEVAIVGCDGLPRTDIGATRLTSIQVPWSMVARQAVELLIAQISGRVLPPETVIPITLFHGDTT